MKYKIVSIKHSGRKGIRGTDVNEPKYEGMINSIVEISPSLENEKIRYTPLHMNFIETESAYDQFHTSAILAISINKNWNYVVETINTLYELEEIKEDAES